VVGAKPFDISKREVWEAFKRVKANQGAAGVDGQSIAAFEANLANNLYKLWNRLSSGSYFPPPVRRVDIPKASGGTRPLGIPTVADRIAQEVVRRRLEPLLEPIFHEDSYGYRPMRSAIDAVRTARQRCWRSAWVIDLDIKAFFDTIDHGLLLKAVRYHTDCRWVLLYVERWLKAPMQTADGRIEPRIVGTPQGGVVSPLLANLFLHYVFDAWMSREQPHIPFERYADDIICHVRTRSEAVALLDKLKARFAECGLALSPQKTKIVYCQDTNRPGNGYPVTSFDFLGFTFRPRLAKWPNGKYGVSFLPAASPRALKSIRKSVRDWGLQRRSDKNLDDLARMFSPYIRGWVNYYSHFYKTALYPTLNRIDAHLLRWARRKFKSLRQRPRQARAWLARVKQRSPKLFPHWQLRHQSGRMLGAV
jgi:group II intron reverse transcriptase/maturase